MTDFRIVADFLMSTDLQRLLVAIVLGAAVGLERELSEKPAGLKTIGVFGCLGTEARDVLVFEAQSHDDIREMVNFWRDTTDFEVHPAVDLAANFRQQGMKVA